MLNAEQYIQDISKKPQNSTAFKLGTIDPAYTSGNPKVLLDGEQALSGATYKYISSYTPAASDRVLLAYANGYVIIGKIV